MSHKNAADLFRANGWDEGSLVERQGIVYEVDHIGSDYVVTRRIDSKTLGFWCDGHYGFDGWVPVPKLSDGDMGDLWRNLRIWRKKLIHGLGAYDPSTQDLARIVDELH